jgi:hypothetical protein
MVTMLLGILLSAAKDGANMKEKPKDKRARPLKNFFIKLKISLNKVYWRSLP